MKAGLWETSERDAKDRCENARRELSDTLKVLDTYLEKVELERYVLSTIESKITSSESHLASVIQKIEGASNDYNKICSNSEEARKDMISLKGKIALYENCLSEKEKKQASLVSNIGNLEREMEENNQKHLLLKSALQEQTAEYKRIDDAIANKLKLVEKRELSIAEREIHIQNSMIDFERRGKEIELADKRIQKLKEELLNKK